MTRNNSFLLLGLLIGSSWTSASALDLTKLTGLSSNSIDLALLPAIENVQLTIYNGKTKISDDSEPTDLDLTLVRERRWVSFKSGANQLQFSWIGGNIDPSSINLNFLEQTQPITIQHRTDPYARPGVVQWAINSPIAQSVLVETYYFTTGLSWQANYIAIISPDQKFINLTGLVKIDNRTKADYPNAEVRLLLGNIHLVESIRSLAFLSIAQLRALVRLKIDSISNEINRVYKRPLPPIEPKIIEKQSLSEYFLYTIEGSETIPSAWAKQLRSFYAQAVPLQIQYRYRPRQYGEQLVQVYRWENKASAQLGQAPLPQGIVTVFQQHEDHSLRFLGQQPLAYVPIGDTAELNLGPDPQVQLQPRIERIQRNNLWLALKQLGQYQAAELLDTQTEVNARVVGWDEQRWERPRIRNFSNRPVDVELHWEFNGDVRFKSALNTRLYDAHTVQVNANAEAGQDLELPYELITRHGYNAKQNRVELATP